MKRIFMLFVLLGLSLSAFAVQAENDPCEPFTQWIGGEVFPYAVGQNGDWNLPADATPGPTVTFKNSGLWVYTSESEQAKFVIVFLDFEASGSPRGQHHICVYRVAYT